jgi:hypothetical protein
MEEDFLEYYDLETYLFEKVRPRFAERGWLSAFDFFCIVIWKANRAKSIIARKLQAKGYDNLETAVQKLTLGIAQRPNPKERLRYLIEPWKFHLPMASAILTVLYPEDFTIYDARVCKVLDFKDLTNVIDFETLWQSYQDFKRLVEASTSKELSLRDKDRYLWGKSFHKRLNDNISRSFAATTK